MLVLFGVIPVVAAFFVALSFLGREDPEAPPDPIQAEVVEEEPPAETRDVIAAARTLEVGTLLGEDDLDRIALELPEVRSEYFVVDEEEPRSFRGYAVRRTIPAGEPLTRSAIVGPGERGFLAAVLEPGTRAVTVRVGSATSRAALIDPGDRVDVILSAELRAGEQQQRVFARTIVEDVRVVAVDQRVDGDEPAASGIETATLEVSPRQDDRLVLAEHEGQLSLTVRSLAAAAGEAAAGAPPGDEAVALDELLLASPALAAREERRQREQELSDLSLLTGIVEAREQHRAAALRAATTTESVRIIRGGMAAEEVVFGGPSPEAP